MGRGAGRGGWERRMRGRCEWGGEEAIEEERRVGGWGGERWEAPASAQKSARPQVGQLRRPELCMLSRAAPRALATHTAMHRIS